MLRLAPDKVLEPEDHQLFSAGEDPETGEPVLHHPTECPCLREQIGWRRGFALSKRCSAVDELILEGARFVVEHVPRRCHFRHALHHRVDATPDGGAFFDLPQKRIDRIAG